MGKNQRSNSEKGSANALLIMAAVVILFLILIVSGILLYRLLPAKKQDTGKKGTEKEETATTDEKEEMEDYTISTFHEDGISKESDDQSESTQKDEGYIEGGSDSAELPLDVEAERQRIVEIYDSINSSKLKKMKGYPSYLTQSNSFLISSENVTGYLDKDDQLRKIETNDEEFGLEIEVYHQPISDTGKRIEDVLPEDTAVFTFAYNSSGKEYRLYFKDHRIIRYIGDDGVKHDFPWPYNYSEILSVDEVSQDREIIRTMLNHTSPGWWVEFEGE